MRRRDARIARTRCTSCCTAAIPRVRGGLTSGASGCGISRPDGCDTCIAGCSPSESTGWQRTTGRSSLIVAATSAWRSCQETLYRRGDRRVRAGAVGVRGIEETIRARAEDHAAQRGARRQEGFSSVPRSGPSRFPFERLCDRMPGEAVRVPAVRRRATPRSWWTSSAGSRRSCRCCVNSCRARDGRSGRCHRFQYHKSDRTTSPMLVHRSITVQILLTCNADHARQFRTCWHA